jgi:hypothetical protein
VLIAADESCAGIGLTGFEPGAPRPSLAGVEEVGELGALPVAEAGEGFAGGDAAVGEVRSARAGPMPARTGAGRAPWPELAKRVGVRRPLALPWPWRWARRVWKVPRAM